MTKSKDDKKQVNPIDPDKVAENPGTLPYAHTVGGVEIRPEDKGKIKGRAMAAMKEQTNAQLNQIREQIELLARQARSIQSRIEVSNIIYTAEMGFEPRMGQMYHLYERENGKHVLSLIAPEEWGRSKPFKRWVATCNLLADHTWEVLEQSEE